MFHISKAPQWEQSPLLKASPHPECLGFHNGRVALFSPLQGAFLRQGVPLFPPRLQGFIDAWDCPIPAPRETWHRSWGSHLQPPITPPPKTDSQPWNAGIQDKLCCCWEVTPRDSSGRFRFQRIMLSPYLELKNYHVSCPRMSLLSP